MNKLLLQIFSVLLIFVSLIFGIANSAIKDKKFICNRYILNTYLYIILTFIIIALQVLIMEYNKIKFNPNMILYVGIFILSLICVIGISVIKAENMILKHSVWLSFIILMSLMFYPMYMLYSKQKGLIMSAILTTLILFLGLSFVAYLRPDLISLSWGPVLFVILIGGILTELLMMFFVTGNKSNSLKYMSYFFIVLFMLYILYDTKRLQVNAKNCVKADYVSESFNLFLDIWNIFIRILSLKGSN